MITDSGKEIIGKYLLGLVPAYATHISLGCGTKPYSIPAESYPADRDIMDFEMIRIPISSRGFVTETDGTTKIVFAAEMPVEERYEVTEVGLWSAGSNSLAKSDSRTLLTFNTSENWQVHKESTPQVITAMPERFDRLNSVPTSNDIETTYEDVAETIPIKIFSTYSDNEVLLSSIRKDRYEGARFLNYTIMMRGDTSSMNSSYVVSSGAQHIHLEAAVIDLSKNSPNDIIKIGTSIISRLEATNDAPYRTRIRVEFLESETNTATGYAYLTHTINDTDLESGSEYNRYYVITKNLSQLEYGPDFSWSKVSVIKIYVSVFENSGDSTPTDKYYVSLDAMRFENITTANPLHVMSGYSIVETPGGYPIYKIPNTSNYIEFRFPISNAVVA